MHVKPRHIILLLFAVVCFGTAGYMALERWSLLDALYMTVITLASVGYGEVRPLDAPGRIFTIVLILTGIASIAFGVQALMARVVESNLLGDFQKRRLLRRMHNLREHIIVCGYGRVGQHVSAALKGHGKPFVLLDRDAPEGIEGGDALMAVLRGDATDENLLLDAGVERARTLVTVVGSDADNLFIVMTARALNPKLHIISRAADRSAEAKLKRAGADKVICPYEIGGRRIVSFILEPFVSEFLDSVTASENIELRLQEIQVAPACRLAGHTLADSRIREESGAIILALMKSGGALTTNPDPRTPIHAGDTLIGLGTTAQLESLRRLAGKETK